MTTKQRRGGGAAPETETTEQAPEAPTAAQKRAAAKQSTKDALAARMALLGAGTPAAVLEEDKAQQQATRPARKTATAKPAGTAAKKTAAAPQPRKAAEPRSEPEAMPAEQDKPIMYSDRINLTVTPEQKRALALAKVDDGIDGTARIRAMITMWQDDEKLRAKIDREARRMR